MDRNILTYLLTRWFCSNLTCVTSAVDGRRGANLQAAYPRNENEDPQCGRKQQELVVIYISEMLCAQKEISRQAERFRNGTMQIRYDP